MPCIGLGASACYERQIEKRVFAAVSPSLDGIGRFTLDFRGAVFTISGGVAGFCGHGDSLIVNLNFTLFERVAEGSKPLSDGWRIP